MNQTTVTIRLATPDDAPAISQIYAPYVENTAISFEYTPPDANEMRRRIEKTLAEYPYLVAINGDTVLGYAYAGAFHGREAYRHCAETSIYVQVSARGMGIGTLLYKALETLLIRQNVYKLYACVATSDDPNDKHLSDQSLHFHQKQGYDICGTHAQCGYKFNKWYNIVWMEKTIADLPEHPNPFVPFKEP